MNFLPNQTALYKSIAASIVTKPSYFFSPVRVGVSLSAISLSLVSMSIPAIAFETGVVVDEQETSLSPQQYQPQVTLPALTVTATKSPTRIDNTIAQTKVIDTKALQRYKGQSVIDVLKHQSGINITQSGGLGTASNFYIRGFDSKQVLVLIDGVRYSSATLGTPSLNLLPADQIDRIEVLYGASGSSLYGSEAMGGVIQIFTKGNASIGNAYSATVGYGSNNHYQVGLNSQYATANTRISVGVSRAETDGFNAVAKKDAYNYQADDDGFESTNASAAIHYDFSDKLSAGISTLYAQSTTDIDSADSYNWQPPYNLIAPALENAYSDQENGAGNAYIQYETNQNKTKLAYGYSIDKSTTYELQGSQGDVFNTTQHNVRLENISHVGRFTNSNQNLGQVIIGAEFLKQNVDSTTNYEEDSRDVTSGFIGYQYADDFYDLQSNYRLDDNSQFGHYATYNLGVAIQPTTGLRIGTNHATGFRAPTFNDLYYPGYSNPDLQPETNKTTEAFIEFANAKQRTRLTGYYTEADNLISGGENINKAEIKGASLTSDWLIDSFIFGLGYEYLDATDDSDYADRASNYHGNDLPYRPENVGTVYVGYQQPRFDVRLEAKYTDERYSDIQNTVKLDSHTLVNLSGNVYIMPNLQGSLRIENLTDEDYTLSNQFGVEYATDDINYFGSLTYTW